MVSISSSISEVSESAVRQYEGAATDLLDELGPTRALAAAMSLLAGSEEDHKVTTGVLVFYKVNLYFNQSSDFDYKITKRYQSATCGGENRTKMVKRNLFSI